MIDEKSIKPDRTGLWLKLGAIVCLLLLVAAILVAFSHPARGYEMDIYAGTPLATWICLSIAMLGGTVLIVFEAATGRYKTSRYWLLGFAILILCRFAVLYFPFIRGYFTWNGDSMTHWGYVLDILSNGHTFDNFYPVIHVFLAQVILITNIPIDIVINLSTAFFAVFFICFIYLLARVILPGRGQQLIAVAIAGAAILEYRSNVFLMPNGWSILLFPLLFYFLFKRYQSPLNNIPFVLMLLMYPFFHPLSSLFLSVSLIIVVLSGPVIRYITQQTDRPDIRGRASSSLGAAAIELVILLPWVLSFNDFHLNVRVSWEQITEGGVNIIGQMANTLDKINIHGKDLVLLYLKMYGADSLLLLLSVIGLVIIVLRMRKAAAANRPFFVIDLGLVFLLYGIAYMAYLAGVPGLDSIGAARLESYALIFTPVLAAIAISWAGAKLRPKVLYAIMALLIIIIPAGLGLRGLYFSPYLIQSNEQITRNNITGMTWMLERKDPVNGWLYISTTPFRFADNILGKEASDKRTDLRQTEQFKDHFGYESYRTLYEQYATVGEQFEYDMYACLTLVDRIIYTTVWKTVGRFTEGDFARFEKDVTVSRIYSNGETDFYYIRATLTPR